MTYSITLERGANGTYLAWVDDLPGCAVRAPSRAEVLEKLPGAIKEFVAWTGQAAPEALEIDVVEEVESAIEADEDTEVLISADRAALTEQDWSQLRESLAKSRSELVALLAGLADVELESKREESERTVREEIEHVAFVELMYAMWTFDLRSREGLAEFLSWTRKVSEERMQQLAAQGATDLTLAEWAGAPRPEPWTARKAARRLLWHELLHLRALEGLGRRP